MRLSGVGRRRIRRPQISKRNGSQKVSRRICTQVPRGKEVSSRRNLFLPSRPQLPNQQYLPLHQHLTASRWQLPLPPLLLPTPHRLPHQPWRLFPQTNRANPFHLQRTFWKVAFRRRTGKFAVFQSVSQVDHNADGRPDDESNPGQLREKTH